MKFAGNVDNGTWTRSFDFGGDPGHRMDPGIFKEFCHCSHKQYSPSALVCNKSS